MILDIGCGKRKAEPQAVGIDVSADSVADHVWNLELHDVPDTAVWLYAREHGFTVVSKDADFSEISMELGFPPKLLWLRIRNWTTDQIEDLIRSKYPLIVELERTNERGILVLFRISTG